ncbi:Inositol-pentakisphosphate 2-kinase [Yamadazyma tenuis]|uniref:Inositol-pentakisphosphate 2-kinase n=1 Tax=Candida tenuis TaxID=2315449 RepID=UPI0027A72F40|nr:Inositol-pentakisphosphate 2-kinase [Yamadazyma tenuis]
MEISKLTSPQEWKYFAKGNANILFEYTGSNDYLRHKLLRLRLLKEDDQYISTCELYDFIELRCKHLFPEMIIDIQLVVLTGEFVHNLDSNGHKMMIQERYGLLLPNILEGENNKQALSKNCNLYFDDQFNAITLELKPKWLYDNKNNNYCRTCSLNQLRGFERHFCPLDFLYPEALQEGLDDVFKAVPDDLVQQIQKNIPVKQLFMQYLQSPKNVFQKLKQYQKINDKNDLIENLTSPNDVSVNLWLVMTLRDVGLFLKFEKYDRNNNIHNSHNNVNNLITIDNGKYLLTSNIYDLDLKSKNIALNDKPT